MKALGDTLRAAREQKGLTCDDASRETHIAVRYLEALEREDFDQFPGEAYLLGFLRNYGEFLGLDPKTLFDDYRAVKIQEQPVPVEQLLNAPPQLPKIIRNVAIILAVAAAGGLVIWFVQHLVSRRSRDKNDGARAPVVWTMEDVFGERRFFEGDTISIPLDSGPRQIEISALGEAVTLITPSGTRILDAGQKAGVDLDDDGFDNIQITVVEFFPDRAEEGALLRLDLEYAGMAGSARPPSAPPAASVPAGSGQTSGGQTAPGQTAPGQTAPGQAAGGQAAPAQAPAQTIFLNSSAYPFTIQVAFQGFCMFRWEILGERDRRGRNEHYFSRGEELSIQAQNGARLWLSNAQAVQIQVSGGGRTVPLETGNAGEVVVADVRWMRDEDGRFRLVLLRLE